MPLAPSTWQRRACRLSIVGYILRCRRRDKAAVVRHTAFVRPGFRLITLRASLFDTKQKQHWRLSLPRDNQTKRRNTTFYLLVERDIPIKLNSSLLIFSFVDVRIQFFDCPNLHSLLVTKNEVYKFVFCDSLID